MTTAKDDALLTTMNELRQGQIAQIHLSEQALALARNDIAARDALIIRMHDEWKALSAQQRDDWKAFTVEQYEKAARKSRTQMRMYGLLMAVLGAFVALSWLNVFRHG